MEFEETPGGTVIHGLKEALLAPFKAEQELERLKAENERLREALRDMLWIFDRGLPEDSIGGKLCEQVRVLLDSTP